MTKRLQKTKPLVAKIIQSTTLLLLILFSSHAFASSPYKLNLQNEIIYLSAGAGLSLAGYLSEKGRTAPTPAELAALDKNNIPAFERQFAGRWNEQSQKLSNITLAAGVLSPLSLFLIDNSANDYFTIGVMYLETLALTSGGITLSKGASPRYRPFVYGDKAPLSARTNLDATRSFFSGHAAFAASGFIFSASVFSDYFPESKYKTAVWAAAITGSVATAVLRVTGGKHFPTDVAAGLAWGATIGYLIPALHKKERDFAFIPFATTRQQGIRFIKQL